MIKYSSKYRSNQSELMDDLDLKGDQMNLLLNDLRRVNKWLGGFRITVDGVETLLKQTPLNTPLTVVDIGCGDGQQLRECTKWAKKVNRSISFVGIDGNPHILKLAQERTPAIDAISYQVIDVFSEGTIIPNADIYICTLFLHHFNEEKIQELLKKLEQKATLGVLVNDLHRSRWAFELFKLFSHTILRTKIARHDGLVSVARGFKRPELQQLTKKIQGRHKIRWKWAFRYQWIIQKT